MNVVELALERRSPEIASKLMKYLMERVTYDPQLARILKKCLVLLNKNYPKIFIETLHHPKLFSLTAELRARFFDSSFVTYCSLDGRSLFGT